MTQIAKLIAKTKNNPKDVRFDDACKIAEFLGFDHIGGAGSHRAFQHPGNPQNLNFQDRRGKIPPYQAMQLIEMIDAYYEEPKGQDVEE